MLNIEKIRKDFPILENTKIGEYPLIYLDNAATTQIPVCVTDAVCTHYRENNANVHRGIHTLSERSTAGFEAAREAVRDFLGAESKEEIIFTSGTTDGINTVAAGLRDARLSPGDPGFGRKNIVVTELEHHSNFLPWQRLCAQTGGEFIVVPCPDGNIDLDAYQKALDKEPLLVAVTEVSNLTGTQMPLDALIPAAHEAGALFLVDGAQGARHGKKDMRALGCDFYALSGHKMMGPTGIGVLYGKKECLERLAPARVGGGMVDEVKKDVSTYGPLPERFEAGTPNYVGAIGLHAAIRYLRQIGPEEIEGYEAALIRYAEERLLEIPQVQILGHPKKRAGVISFTIDGIHPFDAASILDKLGVAMRSGTHCAQPGLALFGLETALRLSAAFYNTPEEIDAACDAIRRVIAMMSKWTKA